MCVLILVLCMEIICGSTADLLFSLLKNAITVNASFSVMTIASGIYYYHLDQLVTMLTAVGYY